MEYDLAIIGGGPAGYNAAARAVAKRLKTILFEKKQLGGVCLNEGCIPTKTLLYSAKVLDSARHAGKYGVLLQEDMTFDYDKIVARKNRVVKRLTAGVSYKLSSNGVTVVQESVAVEGEQEGLFQLVAGEEQYQAKNLLLCTGSETVIPPIKGLADCGYWTSTEALAAKELPRSIAIIGGGVIGIEFAAFYHTMGVEVNVIEMLPEILPAMDRESSGMLRADYTKRGVKFHLKTKVIEVTPTGVVLEKEGVTETIEAERVLVCVGRRPVTAGFGLETLNLEMNHGTVRVNKFMQTSHPRVYAAGDITGFSMLAHTAIREGEVAIEHILGREFPMNYAAIPSIVYTNPEIAGVGKTEEEMIAIREYCRVLKLPMTYSGRFMAENEGGSVGVCKILVDKENRLIGCTMLGNPASELILLAGMAIANGETVESFRRHIFPHPTVSEIFHETLFI
jgi:dihydrolipoamide dehydrogenase